MNRKTLIAGFFITGISLLFTSISAYFVPALLEQPGGLAALFIGTFVAVAGLLGGSIREWADNMFGKKEEPKIKRQINVGDNITNVIADRFVQNIFQSAPGQEVLELSRFTIPNAAPDFVDREDTIEQLKAALLRGEVVIGISGGGGIGKTQLAYKLASEVKEDFPDACLRIDLLGTSEKPMSTEDAMRQLLEPFYAGQKLPEASNQLMGLYQQTFATKKSLVLLDNALNAPQVRSLIPPTPSAAIITSRQHFSLTEFALREPLRLDILSPEKSREFLRSTSDKLREAQEQKVDQLASLCGYLPMALRVSASLLNDRADWSVDTLLQSLADERTRLQRLKRPDDVDLDVEAAIGLSYSLLPDEIKKHFRMLSIFQGYFWITPVVAILGKEFEDDADRLLGVLIARSLLNVSPAQFGELVTGNTVNSNLYAFHDLTRLFASDLLRRDIEESKTAVERHADFFLALAKIANAEFQLGEMHIQHSLNFFHAFSPELFLAWQRLLPTQGDWPRPESADTWLISFPSICGDILELQVSAYQRINFLQVALDTLKTSEAMLDKEDVPAKTEEINISEGIHVPLELAYLNNLGEAYIAAGEARKAVLVLDTALAKLEAEDFESERAYKYIKETVFTNMGNAQFGIRNLKKAIEYWNQQLHLAREINHWTSVCTALGNLGNAYLELEDFLTSMGYYQEQLTLSREIGYRRDEGDALSHIGINFSRWGEVHKSYMLLEQARKIAHDRGDIRREGVQLSLIGLHYSYLGDFVKSIEISQQALVYLRAAGDRQSEGSTLINQGSDYIYLGDKIKARECWEVALNIFRIMEDPRAHWLDEWIKKLEFHEPQFGGTRSYIPELIETVIGAVLNQDSRAAQHFETISKIVSDPDVSDNFRELTKVLQKILVGIKNPDLSQLPEEIASLVRENLEKKSTT
jgi:tetratricopeptide (TPR) repeat protein